MCLEVFHVACLEKIEVLVIFLKKECLLNSSLIGKSRRTWMQLTTDPIDQPVVRILNWAQHMANAPAWLVYCRLKAGIICNSRTSDLPCHGFVFRYPSIFVGNKHLNSPLDFSVHTFIAKARNPQRNICKDSRALKQSSYKIVFIGMLSLPVLNCHNFFLTSASFNIFPTVACIILQLSYFFISW